MRRRAFLALPPALLAGAVLAAPTFAPVRRDTRLAFPRDHGAHPGYRTEWWYVTGALDAPRANIGFQLTFFRSRSGRAEELVSPLAATQVMFAHAALTLPGERLLHAERSARPGLGAGYSVADCGLHVGPWSMARDDGAGGERLRLAAATPDFGFAFELAPTQPLLLQGEHGWSQKGPRPEFASHYLSWPQLEVSGSLRLDGSPRPARGRAWFDHEWSSAVLAPGAVGWDWIGINLDDGGALMAFRIRDAGGGTVHAGAMLRDATGRQTRFGPEAVSFRPLRRWRSPRNGADYPVEEEILVGPHRLRTRPVLDDQEIGAHRPLPVAYWEGLVTLEGGLRGRGYQELAGYAAPLRV
ncbi:MAG: carotenoid 1,2-hydratase [Rhodocyclales bacterium]|nr:carotenoid 1,2-hydratase [Rhodocyclales bacterium]